MSAGLTKERIQEFKDILEEKSGKEVSWEEASEGAYNLVGFVEILYELHIEDQKRKKKLEEFPKGFHLDGDGYTCAICSNSASKEETWYDKYGIKCLTCQKAINRKIIPALTAKNQDSWYSKYDLESRFNIKHQTLKKFIKEGILKARIVPKETGRPHAYLFLIKDNKGILPPKKMTESHMVAEEKDGKTWHRLEPWYKFVDPKKALREYKIMDYPKVTSGEK